MCPEAAVFLSFAEEVRLPSLFPQNFTLSCQNVFSLIGFPVGVIYDQWEVWTQEQCVETVILSEEF